MPFGQLSRKGAPMDGLMRILGEVFISILRPFMGLWLKYLVNCKATKPFPPGLKPPYLILSTHVSVFEMPYLLMSVKPNPVIVLHELHLTEKIFVLLLSMVGSIWRMQGVPDARTIRQMKRAVKKGRSVLIYPEGDLNWDGDSLALDMSMARVARFIGAPVLVFRTKGSYMAFPRWAHRARRGRVDVEYELAVKAEEFANLTDEQVLERLNKAFMHSERRWLSEEEGKGQGYSSSKPALGIERLLFMCPSCGCDSCMKSDNYSIACSKCGYSARVDADLKLSDEGRSGFADVWGWHDWQLSEWRAKAGAALRDGSLNLSCSPLKAEIVLIEPAPEGGGDFTHRILKMPVRLDAASASLTPSGISLTKADGKPELVIPMAEIRSVQVFIVGIYDSNWLIVMTDHAYYKLQLIGDENPCYAWLLAIKGHLAEN